jgi:hypothetical protein
VVGCRTWAFVDTVFRFILSFLQKPS